jgi:hypothetical protein
MNTAPLTRRILKIFHSATPQQVIDGLKWYDAARQAAHDIAAGTPYSIEQVSAVIAALSPEITWSQNKKAARQVVENHAAGNRNRVGRYGANSEKAYKILEGDISVLRGKKVTAFHANIMGDTSAVTIDRHAYSIATGRRIQHGKSITVAEQRIIERAYRNAAARVGVEPSEMQAITWSVLRGTAE